MERIYEALKPEGRLVLVEPFSAGGRALPREEQEKKHQIAPELVEEDLRLAGFRVVSRNEELTPLNEEGARDFLVLAVKPSQ
jgi:predicted methyltransferase